jgi:vacuolar-type H+-ATPase subunit E/Vma4
MASAREKARLIVEEAENETRRGLDQANASSELEANEILSSARAEAENIKRREISDVRHRVKLLEESEKSKIVNDVLDETKKRVTEILRDDRKYVPFLTMLAVDGIRAIGLDSVVIHLNSGDLKRITPTDVEREVNKNLQTPVKVNFSEGPIGSYGGVVISSIDGKTRVVNTLDQRFEALESKLLIEAGKILFGE